MKFCSVIFQILSFQLKNVFIKYCLILFFRPLCFANIAKDNITESPSDRRVKFLTVTPDFKWFVKSNSLPKVPHEWKRSLHHRYNSSSNFPKVKLKTFRIWKAAYIKHFTYLSVTLGRLIVNTTSAYSCWPRWLPVCLCNPKQFFYLRMWKYLEMVWNKDIPVENKRKRLTQYELSNIVKDKPLFNKNSISTIASIRTII